MLSLSQILGKKKYRVPSYTQPAALMVSISCFWSLTLKAIGKKTHIEGRPDGYPGNSQVFRYMNNRKIIGSDSGDSTFLFLSSTQD